MLMQGCSRRQGNSFRLLCAAPPALPPAHLDSGTRLRAANPRLTLKRVGLPDPPPLRCKPYQCLYCLGDTVLPLEERFHNLGSKYSLQWHFDRCHPFEPGEPCPFPPECAAVTLDSMMHSKNHVVTVHGIYMPDKI